MVGFFREQRGATFASSALMESMTRAFVAGMERFAKGRGGALIAFERGQCKDDVPQWYLAELWGAEGVLFIGKAQERATVVETARRYSPESGAPYAWLVRATAMVNQYYCNCVRRLQQVFRPTSLRPKRRDDEGVRCCHDAAH